MTRRLLILSFTATGCRSPSAKEATTVDGCAPLDVSEVAVWVDAEAAEGGDGSVDAPFREIQTGLQAAGVAGGGEVAVASGTYRENLSFTADHVGVSLLGACEEQVTVEADIDAPGIEIALGRAAAEVAISGISLVGGAPGVLARRGGLRLQDSSIEGSAGVGVWVYSSATLTAEDIKISNTEGYGLWAYGGTLNVSGVIVQDVGGIGIAATYSSADLILQDVVIDGVTPFGTFGGYGLLAESGALVSAQNLTILNTNSYGVDLYGASRVSLDGLTVQNAAGTGVSAIGGTRLTLADADISYVIAETSSGYLPGWGVFVATGAWLLAVDLDIADTASIGLMVSGSTTQADVSTLHIANASGTGVGSVDAVLNLADVVIDAVVPEELGDGDERRASLVAENSTVEVDDLAVVNTILFFSGGSATLSDIQVRGDPGAENDIMHPCIQLSGTEAVPIDATLRDAHLADCTGHGIRLEDGILSLQRVSMSNTGWAASFKSEDTTVAPALHLADAIVFAQDLTIDAPVGVGVLVNGGSAATLVDVQISGSRRMNDASMAIGVAVQGGGDLSATGLQVDDSDGVGLAVINEGSAICEACTFERNSFAGVFGTGEVSLALSGGTRIADSTADADLGGGLGVMVGAGASASASPKLTLSELTVTGSALSSVYLEGQGSYEISDCTLEAGVLPSGQVYPGRNAVFATGGVGMWDGDQGLRIADTTFSGEAEGAVFLDDQSTASLDTNRFSASGFWLVQDRCNGVAEPEGGEALEGDHVDGCEGYDHRVELPDYYLFEVALEAER